MYTNKTSMRTQIPSTQQHIYPNASEITLSMMLDTRLQRITHTGRSNILTAESDDNDRCLHV